MAARHDASYLTQMVTLLTQILAASGGGAGTYTDRSGTISTGGSTQEIAAANSSRVNIIVQNPSSEIESLYVNFGDDAAADDDSIELLPGQFATFATTQAVDVIAATTSHVFIAKELVTA